MRTHTHTQAVPVHHNSFENRYIYTIHTHTHNTNLLSSFTQSFILHRLPLPEAWRGLRGAELDQVAGIPNCVFVHSSGFIGGNETFEGALKMAAASLKQQ